MAALIWCFQHVSDDVVHRVKTLYYVLMLQVQTTALCMCVDISATVALGCLFVPKVYIVLFQPHKNVRQGSKGAPGTNCGRPFFGRQSSRFSSLAAMNGDITSPSNNLNTPLATTALCTQSGGESETTCDPDMDDLVWESIEANSDNQRADALLPTKSAVFGLSVTCV